MARSIAQTLPLARALSSAKLKSQSCRLLPRRTQSNQSSSDLESDPLIRKLEDAIHCIVVRRSAPDWLPFLPGASYWVPPPRQPSNGLAQLLHNLANPNPNDQDQDQSTSLTTLRGWPCSSYFIQGGAAAPHPVEVPTASEDDKGEE